MPVSAPPAVLAKFVQRARQLYTLPAVALRILELMQTRTVDVNEVRKCIESDPALVSKLLRVVNSSLFGLSAPVADLNQAIALLGMERLKLLVLGFSLPTLNNTAVEPGVLERYWRHSLLKSVTAKELATGLWKCAGDEAFVAGLLQDIGLMALVQDLGEPYVKFLHGVWDAGNEPREMEAEILGFDHVALSAKLMEDWRLPAQITHAVAVPLDSNEINKLAPNERTLAQILHTAELVTRFLLGREVRWLDELLTAGKDYVAMTTDQLREILIELETKAPMLAAALSIPWNDEGKYARLIEEVRQRQREAIRSAVPASLLKEHADGTGSRKFPSHPLSGMASTCQPNGSATTANTASGQGTRGNRIAAPQNSEPLCDQLAAAVAGCRQTRLPISLAIVQLDDYETAKLSQGADRVHQLMDRVASLIQIALDDDQQLETVTLTDTRLAVILPGVDRRQAIRVGRDILDQIRNRPADQTAANRPLSVSVGLASLTLPPRNFPVSDMVQAAERCLHGVQLSGGDGLKSIEIC